MRVSQLRHAGSTRFWILAAFITLTLLIGGGSRPDIQSLIVLRPVAVLLCGYALLSLNRDHLRGFGILFGLTAAIFLSVAVQLIPLPPSIWMRLPGRDLIADIDRVAALGAVWRPITLHPVGTWNALFSMFVPIGVLLLAVQITREERFRLLYLFCALGLASGLLGLIQISGPIGGPLYLYTHTNDSSAVGLFANRNHAAVFLACLFPMLALLASAGITRGDELRRRSWAAIAIGFFLVPLILVTGSRAGLLIGLAGLVSVPFLYRAPIAWPRSSRRWLVFLLGGIALVGLVLLFVAFSRGEATTRLLESSSEEARFQFWGPILDLAWRYFPVGTGAGSFVEIFQIHEPYEMLRVNYLNHAHNDWLELLLTGGLPALALMIIAIAGLLLRSLRVWTSGDGGSRDIAIARMASVILLMLGIASIGDYPARTPSIMCLVMLAAVWLCGRGEVVRRGIPADDR